jgi:hypothetical protein
MVGLISLSAHALISFGYLLYESLSHSAEFSVFDNCSSAGAIACLIGLVASAIGKGSSKLWVVFGSVAGLFTWYLTIGPAS